MEETTPKEATTQTDQAREALVKELESLWSSLSSAVDDFNDQMDSAWDEIVEPIQFEYNTAVEKLRKFDRALDPDEEFEDDDQFLEWDCMKPDPIAFETGEE